MRCHFAPPAQAALLTAMLLFVFSPARAQSTPTAADANVTFCSYNLKNWLAMDRFDGVTTTKGAPKPEKEKEAVVAILAAIHPDILGVCEIGGPDDLKDLQARLRAKGVNLQNFASGHGGDPVRRLGLLSRFPIIAQNHQTDLSYQIGTLKLQFNRGILDATVKVADGFDLHCLGVHLKSMRPVPEADQALMRRNEAHLLRKHIDSIHAATPAPNIVLYGDFNEHRNQPAIDEIIGSRASDTVMTEVKLWDRNGELWTHFWDAADEYSRLDYFFVSKPLRNHIDFSRTFIYSKREFYKASDHRPIVMNISVKPLGTGEP